MNNSANKKENRRALKTFIPIVLLAALAGGIAGAAAQTGSAAELSSLVARVLREGIYAAAPYCVIIGTMAGAAAAMLLYFSAVKEFKNAGADSHGIMKEELDEQVLDSLEEKMSLAMVVVSVYLIVCSVAFSAVMAYIRRGIEEHTIITICSILFFVVGSFGGAKLQQMMIDFEKLLNPEKRGSVYDRNFNAKWLESCDEMERLMIYKSAYKAFGITNLTCSIFLTALTLLSLFFDYGTLPAICVGAVWLSMILSYSMEAIKLSKSKINE